MRSSTLGLLSLCALVFAGCTNTFTQKNAAPLYTIRAPGELGQPEELSIPVDEPATEPTPIPSANFVILKEVNSLKTGGTYWPLLGSATADRRALVSGSSGLQVFSAEPLRDPAAAPLFTISPTDGSDYRLGFDYDGDGRVDVFEITQNASGEICGNGQMRKNRSLRVLSGNSGSLLMASGNIKDACISVNGGISQAYPSVHRGAFQWGAFDRIMALVPQYLSTGWLFAGASAYPIFNPETSAFANYMFAQPMLQPSAQGLSYSANQQPMNGLMVNHAGGVRYVAATSGRFLKYTVGDYSSQQLLADAPFLARADLVGRNYGMLQHDSVGNSDLVYLVTGTPAADLFSDVMKYAATNIVLGSDLWAGIERHVSIYNLSTNQVAQKFYSYAHDMNDGFTYRQRTTYPSRILLPSKDATGSKMIYNVFDGTTWNVHISSSGGTASQIIIANYYVWDVVERAGGEVDVLFSPVDTVRNVMVPDYLSTDGTIGSWRNAFYFPKMTTEVQRWSKTTESFVLRRTIDGGIPDLSGIYPQTATSSNGTGYSFPSQRVMDLGNQRALLVLRGAAGLRFEAALD